MAPEGVPNRLAAEDIGPQVSRCVENMPDEFRCVENNATNGRERMGLSCGDRSIEPSTAADKYNYRK